MKPCPHCGERIQETARKCRFCGEFLSGRGGGRRSSQRRRSSGSSGSNMWIIVVVLAGGLFVLAIPCLIALFLPAVQQAREAARQEVCRTQLKEIGVALRTYHEVYGSLPPAYVPDEQGRPMHSWRVLILPWIGEKGLYESYDFSKPWDSPANRRLLERMPEVYRCPSSPAGSNVTSYAAVVGPDCMFPGPDAVDLDEVPDSASTTLLVGETSTGIPWTKPQDVEIARHPALGDPQGFSSHHPDRVQFAAADDSVQRLSVNIAPETLSRLFLRNDGKAVQVDF